METRSKDNTLKRDRKLMMKAISKLKTPKSQKKVLRWVEEGLVSLPATKWTQMMTWKTASKKSTETPSCKENLKSKMLSIMVTTMITVRSMGKKESTAVKKKRASKGTVMTTKWRKSTRNR